MSYTILEVANNWRNLIAFLIIALFIIPSESAHSQISRKRVEHLREQHKAQRQFPDEYSELDGKSSSKAITDEAILNTLENSRQRYLQALIMIQKGDTIAAARFFQQAIDILNKLVSYPNIEQNEDFADLAQSIVEDYESYITNIESLDDSASLFIIRDKLFQEIENIPPAANAKPAAAPAPKVKYPFLHSTPDKLMIPLIDNDDVNRNINFLTKNRAGIQFMKDCLARSGRWFPMMRRIAENEGIPEEILYLSMIESRLDPNAVSSAKAVGLWQFMRATGQDYKLNETESFWIDERRDPEKSTLAAMRHLRDLYFTFGDWHLALAAYNCGTGCVRRAIRRTNKTNPNYWDVRERLPRETKYYVPFFIATAKVAMNPELYGFDPDEIEYGHEYKYDIYQINEPTSLSSIAHAAGISLEELKALNPELLQNITPPDRKVYFIKIPYNNYQSFAANFEALSPEDKQPFVFHKVERNETLAQIAKKYSVSVTDLVEINGLSGYRAKLKTGDELRIPVGSSPLTQIADIRSANDDSDTDDGLANNPSIDNSNIGQIITHTVQRGESIYSIANRYGIRTTDLRNLNNLSFDDDNIYVGQKLIIAHNKISDEDLAQARQQQAASKTTTIRHKVTRGETLARIADNYSTTIAEISKQNNLNNNNIKIGQMLTIKTNVAQSTPSQPRATENRNTSVHLVKRGETLSSIANLYGVTESQLRQWNPNDISGTVIIAGSRLKVSEGMATAKGSSTNQTKSNAAQPVYYNIKKGDTLGSIARRYGVTVNDIKKNNRNLNENRLQVGQRIRIK